MDARAEDDVDDAELEVVDAELGPRDPFEAFPLAVPHKPHVLRATVEVGGVLAVGFVDYLLHTSARGGEVREGDAMWALRYDWQDLRGKFTGSGYELDNNRIGTNYASHPFAGTLYYTVARSNHLGIPGSVLFAAVGSSAWEYFGEIREKVSVNDMLVTPLAGAALGEATMQLWGFFRRGRRGFVNEALAFVFSPVASVNAWTDEGSEPLRASTVDALGLPREPWHRFALDAGVGVTSVAALPGRAPRVTFVDERLALTLEIANLPGYDGAEKVARLFSDGNQARIAVEAARSNGELVDGVVSTRVMPAGLYVRDARVDDHGRVTGSTALGGLLMGFSYSTHVYDREGARPRDVVAYVSPVGVGGEASWQDGPFRMRAALDVTGLLAGVRAYALADDPRGQARPGLPSTTRAQGYYHALGVGIAPEIGFGWGPVDAIASAGLETFRPIRGLDSEPYAVDRGLRLEDQRLRARVTIAARLPHTPLRLSAHAQHMRRHGDVGETHAARSETSMWGSLGVVF